MNDNVHPAREGAKDPRHANGGQHRLLILWAMLSVLFVSVVQLGSSVAAADSGSTETDAVFLPATLSGYYDGVEINPGGISGRVTVNGGAVEGIPIDLYYYDGNKWSIADSTETDESSYYRFRGVEPLLPGEEYYASFGPNETDPNLLYNWYGPIIDDYQEGDRVLGGDFDLADVTLLSPESGFVGELPITFQWERRELNRESYKVVVIDLDENIFWPTFDLGDVDSFELKLLAPDMLFNKQYAWYVEVYSGPDSFGESFDLYDIEFRPPSAMNRPARDADEAHPFQAGSDSRRGRR